MERRKKTVFLHRYNQTVSTAIAETNPQNYH